MTEDALETRGKFRATLANVEMVLEANIVRPSLKGHSRLYSAIYSTIYYVLFFRSSSATRGRGRRADLLGDLVNGGVLFSSDT